MTFGDRGPAGSTARDATPMRRRECADAHTSVLPPCRHLGAGLADGPRRVPRIARDVLAAQRGVRVGVGDDVAELLEAVVVDARDVEAVGCDVRGANGRRAHALTVPVRRRRRTGASGSTARGSGEAGLSSW